MHNHIRSARVAICATRSRERAHAGELDVRPKAAIFLGRVRAPLPGNREQAYSGSDADRCDSA